MKKVLFSDIPNGTEITLRSRNNLDAIDFTTTVADHVSGFVLLEAVCEESDGIEAVIDFESNFTSCDILWEDNGVTQCFRPRVIRNLSLGDGVIFHVISGNVTGEEKNRRETPRFDYVKGGVSIVNGTRTFSNVRVHDISMTGFSLITNESTGLGSKVKLSFMTEDNRQLILEGTVVRIIDSKGEHLFGCQMEKDNPELNKLIMEIQRDILTKHKRKKKF